jgi:hypothetical protein
LRAQTPQAGQQSATRPPPPNLSPLNEYDDDEEHVAPSPATGHRPHPDPPPTAAITATLSTVPVQQAYKLAERPTEPRNAVEKGDTLWPSAPDKEVSLIGRGSVYSFLRSDKFKSVGAGGGRGAVIEGAVS